MKERSQQIDRYLDGSLDANEIKELFAWLAESPQNAEVFARQSLLDQHLTELLDGGFAQPLETTLDKSGKLETVQITVRSWRRFQRLVWAGGLAAACLIVFLSVFALMRSQEVTDLRYELELARHDAAPAGTEESAIINIYAKEVADLKHELELARQDTPLAQPDDTTTINLYLKEHQDVVARHVSYSPATPQPAQMRVNQHDILYYEFLDDEPDGPQYTHPGIIVRGPLSQGPISPPKAPIISNGHTLSLSEAKETAKFDLVAPPWLHPYYKLDQIRTIEDRDGLQLLYTDGTNTMSLFEQPLDGRRGLEPKDFREYAVYRNEHQVGGTILAWRDDVHSYVLIGNIEMSQLMDMAQSISNGR